MSAPITKEESGPILPLKKPLFIGCSGGSGHNVAIEALIRSLNKNNLMQGDQIPFTEPNSQQAKTGIATVQWGAAATNLPLCSPAIKMFLDLLALPSLPDLEDLEEEVLKLKKEQEKKGLRQYVDVLLDIIPAGYYYTAICNVLHKQEKTDELIKLISFQKDADSQNYEIAKAYFLKRLDEAYLQRCPHTEVISTQALALPALCDAVKEYNKKRNADLKIHQYMTDLPTEGAIHFFNSLSSLKPEQSELMHLYAVNLHENLEALDKKFKLSNLKFAGLVNIDPKQNPMIRDGFMDPKLAKIKFDKDLALKIKVGKGEQEVLIKANEKVACIMLGSLACGDTVDYVAELARQENFVDQIFVFGGNSPHLKGRIEEEIQRLEKEKKPVPKITLLDPQDDVHIAPLMTRSNQVIIRGGGLTSMEQMAMPHLNQGQEILFHSKRNDQNQFTSGVRWEDANADAVKAYLKKKYHLNKIQRTQPREVVCELKLRHASKNLPEGPLTRTNAFPSLMQAINYYRDKPGSADFVNAFDALYSNLEADYNSKLQQGLSAKLLDETASLRVAKRTVQFLQDFKAYADKGLEMDKKGVQGLIKQYEKDCNHIPGAEMFGKVLAVAILATLGFILGASLGGMLALSSTVWATTGGVVASLSATTLSSFSLFKPQRLNKDIKVIEQASQVFCEKPTV